MENKLALNYKSEFQLKGYTKFYDNEIVIKGSNVEEIINILLTEIENQNKLAYYEYSFYIIKYNVINELNIDLYADIDINKYLSQFLPLQSSYNTLNSNIKELYFNIELIHNHENADVLIKTHKDWKVIELLRKEVELAHIEEEKIKKLKSEEIREHNDIKMLEILIKRYPNYRDLILVEENVKEEKNKGTIESFIDNKAEINNIR